MNRYYLDYNSTSPLSEKVTDLLRSGDVNFLNPSSLHTSGKFAKRNWNDHSTKIKNWFQLPNYELVVTSCATESLTQFAHIARENDFLFAYAPTDHAAVRENAEYLKQHRIETYEMPITKTGELAVDTIISDLKGRNKKIMLIFTWVHNETGWVWDLSLANKLKKELHAFIVVDAVQSVGKLENLKIDSNLDAYVFSAHKWGGLKGVGLTLLQPGLKISPLIRGGTQQHGMRAGTQNVLGLACASLALDDVSSSAEIKRLRTFRDEFKQQISQIKNVKVFNFQNTNANTIFLGLPKRSDAVLPILDVHGFEVSFGAACSAGTAVESSVMKALGENHFLHHSLRISLGMKHLDQKDLISDFVEQLKKAIQ